MAVQDSDSASTDSESENYILDPEKEDGWEDVEPDEENIKVISLFSKDEFPDIKSMLQDCKERHSFDFLKVRNDHGLGFLETIKLVNYIRSEVVNGNEHPNTSSKKMFEAEKYLQPVIEDDALIFSLDELDLIEPSEVVNQSLAHQKGSDGGLLARVAELEAELRSLHIKMADYRETVSKVLDDRWASADIDQYPQRQLTNGKSSKAPAKDNDSHYFKSYSYNEIHETMLKDRVRTDAYRDFIYDYKHLIKGKVVLDVGCGTGILSMFCAKAGAKKVLAVDNSEILWKAAEIIHDNGLDHVITTIHGKIEEVTLPVDKVDIIVSEWMGYCLLYEAMLDSVLWARDRYLTPAGLMVPSHTTLHIAPLSDPDYIADRISFWNSVYGFSMKAMLANIYDEVLIRDLKSSLLPADSQPFLHLPLHTATTEHLSFTGREFRMSIMENIDSLDGFVIWFDTFFLTSREQQIPAGSHANQWSEKNKGKGVAFTTGPDGEETHWRQGVLLIDYSSRKPEPLKEGDFIEGHIGYRKHKHNERELDIEVEWSVNGTGQKNKQVWFMR